MKLYDYYRSSAAYRLRIALNLKGLIAEHIPIHLRRQEQAAFAYRSLNPAGLVPALEYEGHIYSQSLAIIEYLNEIQPEPPLLPRSAADRAYVRSLALSIACDIHPLNNLRVLNFLKNDMQQDDAQRDSWYAHWIRVGFTSLEAVLAKEARVGSFCCGESPGLADICLVPQLYNAERMRCDTEPYPTLRRIAANARALPAFIAAEPERQADAE
jgi:maleylpyruvate isomerase